MPSTVIRHHAYLPDTREMVVEFTTGRIYVYADVPAEEIEAFRAAFSKGRYFNARIRDRYRFRKITRA